MAADEKTVGSGDPPAGTAWLPHGTFLAQATALPAPKARETARELRDEAQALQAQAAHQSSRAERN